MRVRQILWLIFTPLREIWRWWQGLGSLRNLILFLLTILTTLMAGGLVFSATLMTILLAHEMGHFLMSRRYHVPASLPFFIPFLPPFGTMGAVIKMRGQMRHRRALFDMAAAGPLAGLFFTVPAIILGLQHSTIVSVSETSPFAFQLGESILFRVLERSVLGSVPDGYEVLLHPMAFAGWIGLYVTALNLLPIGQLDGGHIIYALLGKRSRNVFIGVLILFALFAQVFFQPWLVLVGLIVILRLYRHPPPQDDIAPLGLGRKLIGVFVVLLFFLGFTPVPFPDIM